MAISACRLGSVAMATACTSLSLDQSAPVAISFRLLPACGPVPRCARHCCRRAQPPRSADRRGTPAAEPCGRNCCRRCRAGSRLEAPRCRNFNARHGFGLNRHATQGRFGAGPGDFHDCNARATLPAADGTGWLCSVACRRRHRSADQQCRRLRGAAGRCAIVVCGNVRTQPRAWLRLSGWSLSQ